MLKCIFSTSLRDPFLTFKAVVKKDIFGLAQRPSRAFLGELLFQSCGKMLTLCFCAGVFVVVFLCFCSGVVVFCGCVFVVVWL